MSLGAISTHLLDMSRNCDSTTSLGSLVQCLTTLPMKKFFLTPNLNLPWCNLRPFAHILRTPLSYVSYIDVLNSNFKSTVVPTESQIKCKEMLEVHNLFLPCQGSTYSCRCSGNQGADMLFTNTNRQPWEH